MVNIVFGSRNTATILTSGYHHGGYRGEYRMPFYDGQIVTNLYWIARHLKSLKVAAWMWAESSAISLPSWSRERGDPPTGF